MAIRSSDKFTSAKVTSVASDVLSTSRSLETPERARGRQKATSAIAINGVPVQA
jgi:hypothetical protein